MSYPSLASITEKKAVNLEEADQEEIDLVFIEAFKKDLNKGYEYLKDLAEQAREEGGRVLKIEDPNSSLGKQLIRLLGTDVARNILSRHLGVAFGLYNCCSPVAAPSEDELNLSAAEQAKLQNGDMASADC